MPEKLRSFGGTDWERIFGNGWMTAVLTINALLMLSNMQYWMNLGFEYESLLQYMNAAAKHLFELWILYAVLQRPTMLKLICRVIRPIMIVLIISLILGLGASYLAGVNEEWREYLAMFMLLAFVPDIAFLAFHGFFISRAVSSDQRLESKKASAS